MIVECLQRRPRERGDKLCARLGQGEAARREIRADWLADLRERAFAILKNSETGSPSSTVRRYRAWVRAEGAFLGNFYKDFCDPYFPKDPSHVAA